jgi:hypothetical protein
MLYLKVDVGITDHVIDSAASKKTAVNHGTLMSLVMICLRSGRARIAVQPINSAVKQSRIGFELSL